MFRHAFLDTLIRFWHDEDGQSITEYGAVLAFVAVLIALAFGLARGGLFANVSGSYSVTVENLKGLNSYSSSSSS